MDTPQFISYLSCSAVAEALLSVSQQVRAGAVFHPNIIPVCIDAITNHSTSAKAGLADTDAARPGTKRGRPISARSNVSAGSAGGVSHFSMGSDAVVVRWHAGAPVDIEALTRLMLMVIKVLQKMERWRTAFDIGGLHSCGGCSLLRLDICCEKQHKPWHSGTSQEITSEASLFPASSNRHQVFSAAVTAQIAAWAGSNQAPCNSYNPVCYHHLGLCRLSATASLLLCLLSLLAGMRPMSYAATAYITSFFCDSCMYFSVLQAVAG